MEKERTAYHSPSILEYGKAMLKVQEALEPVIKNAETAYKTVKYAYATLNKVLEACLPILRANELWLSQYSLPSEPGSIYLVTRIVHIPSGEFQESHLIMPAPKGDPQGYGSALTYARRYDLQVAVGIVCEEDDDAKKASEAIAGEAPDAAQGNTPRNGKGTPARSKQPQRKEQAQPQSGQDIPESVLNAIAGLPELNGVKYEAALEKGQYYILAKGKTGDRKQMLEGAGFHPGKNPNQVWYKLAEAA